MVHALREAHRVLKPNGLLLDLRPGPVHRRVGIEVDGQYREVAMMNESLEDDHAANRAVNHVLQEGRFKRVARIQVNCNRTMILKDFAVWLADFPIDREALQEQLVRTIERSYAENGKRKKIIVKGPLVLKVLRKVDSLP